MPSKKPPHLPDPYSGYNFYVEWDGIIHAGFQECSGLNATQNVNEYREGLDPSTNRKLPGMVTYGNITLRRGITDNTELWDWCNASQRGKAERREVSIVLLNNTGDEKIRWDLTHCWPTSWTAPDLNAGSDEVAIEAMELVHEGITVNEWK
jgi:phage tail-like protein